MEKDFLSWHVQKSALHEHTPRVFFHEREVWFAALGANIGFEQDGRGDEYLRPVLVLKKFNNEVFWSIPLTKKRKEGRYYISFSLAGKASTAILSQMRLIDAKRLRYKIGSASTADFIVVKERLRRLLA